MRLSPATPRKSKISESSQHHLNMYALAAGAAGVGLLAMAQPAEAEIVYTRAHIPIGHSTFVDLNGDGVNDIQFTTTFHSAFGPRPASGVSFFAGSIAVGGAQAGNYILGTRSNQASARRIGAHIGPEGNWRSKGPMVGWAGEFITGVGDTNTGVGGPWVGTGKGVWRCVGIKFQISGTTHFGWARVKVTVQYKPVGATALITGYAYETLPDTPIVAGRQTGSDETSSIGGPNPSGLNMPAAQPTTLGLLATGVSGLSAWRREELLATSEHS